MGMQQQQNLMLLQQQQQTRPYQKQQQQQQQYQVNLDELNIAIRAANEFAHNSEKREKYKPDTRGRNTTSTSNPRIKLNKFPLTCEEIEIYQQQCRQVQQQQNLILSQ